MKLILIRHAEAEHNVQQLMVGHDPSLLTDKSKQQVQSIAKRLSDVHIDAAFSSPSMRAQHTAEGILLFHPEVELQVSGLLRERNMGSMEGKSRKVFLAAAKSSGLPWHAYTPSGGESMDATRHRAAEFIKPIEEMYKGKTVLVVSHGGFIRALVAHLLRREFDDQPLRMNNPAITILKMDDDGKHQAHVLNDVTHLNNDAIVGEKAKA